jgi:hypothetical protein
MTTTTEIRLTTLLAILNFRLDRIHDEAIANFRRLAKSTGQRTRADRL